LFIVASFKLFRLNSILIGASPASLTEIKLDKRYDGEFQFATIYLTLPGKALTKARYRPPISGQFTSPCGTRDQPVLFKHTEHYVRNIFSWRAIFQATQVEPFTRGQ
jgi:hypothetical protein